MSIDVLAIGAHPDDVEIGIGGLVRKLTEQGRRVAILDLTQGEMASRGSVEERGKEAQRAAEILGVILRENACLPDSALANTTDQQRRIIPFLRKHQPRVILAPMRGDLHPDHEAAHFLARDANHFAGLAKLDTGSELKPWRAERAYFYAVYREPAMPQLIIDVSAQFDAKLESLRAYRSQFHNPAFDGPRTYVAGEQFWESIRTRAAYWGTRLAVVHGANQGDKSRSAGIPAGIPTSPNALYGECLFSDAPIPVPVVPGLEDSI